MSQYLHAILAGALLALSSRAFAQTDDFGANMKMAAEKQSGQKYFQAFGLYVAALKQASTPGEKHSVSAAVAAWIAEQRRFYNCNTGTVETVKKNVDSFEGAALFEAAGLIARAYENQGDLQQAWEWHNRRLASNGIPDDKLAEVRTHLQALRQLLDQHVEAIKTYEGIMADPAASDNAKVEARFKRITALSQNVTRRADYFRAAEEFLADEAVASDWKLGVFEGLKNVYTQNRDWDNAASCLRKYADFKGLAPASKPRILFMLGDVHWRQRHQWQAAVHVFREIGAISNVSTNAKQDAETWIVMLTERF
jgi:tetratricopeptide (TPR) repeat protein